MRDINLMPEELKDFSSRTEMKKIKISIKVWIIGAVILFIAFISFLIPRMIVGTLGMKVHAMENKLQAKAYTDVQAIDQQVEAQNAQIAMKNEVIGQIDSEIYPVSGMLRTLKNVLPEGCNLTSVELNDKTLCITGVSNRLIDAASIMVNMDRLDYIDSNQSSENISIDNMNPALKYKFKLNFAVGRKEGK